MGASQYPWEYTVLVQKLRARYIDFKENDKYHTLRKKLATVRGKRTNHGWESRVSNSARERSLRRTWAVPEAA